MNRGLFLLYHGLKGTGQDTHTHTHTYTHTHTHTRTLQQSHTHSRVRNISCNVELRGVSSPLLIRGEWSSVTLLSFRPCSGLFLFLILSHRSVPLHTHTHTLSHSHTHTHTHSKTSKMCEPLSYVLM